MGIVLVACWSARIAGSPRGRDENVNPETDQLSCEVRQPLRLSVSKSPLDGDIPALNPAVVAQPLLEYPEQILSAGGISVG
jgi:hypothetical protein